VQYFNFSRLSLLDVKWANIHKGNEGLYLENHSNPYYELIMVIEGPIHLQVGQERMELQSGEMLVLKPWEQHSGWRKNAEESTFFWVQFVCEPGMSDFHSWTGAAGDPVIVHMPESELRTHVSQSADRVLLPRRFRPERRYKVLSLFENLLYEYNRPQGYFRMRQSLLLGHILEVIASDLLEHHRQDVAYPPSFLTYRNLIYYLDENYGKEISKETIEARLDRKYEYLCHIFKKNCGLTISAYIQQLRIQRAKHLLLNSSRSIGDIAEEIGYRDSLYFSRLFKKAVGISPSRYRERTAAETGQLPGSDAY
jgi:AraC-like DNA-binding protein